MTDTTPALEGVTPEAVAAILKDVTWVRNNIEALAADLAAQKARANAAETALQIEQRTRIIVTQQRDAAEAKVAKLVDALTNLPAVYAHQINTGVREVYDPLQRFYTMESVLTVLMVEDFA